jgi:hypothetical protein
MKNIIVILGLLFGITLNAQKATVKTTKLTLDDVYTANELIFYGLDFSNFRLVEPDRINEGVEIKNSQIPGWNSFLLNEVSMNKLAKWLKKTKVIYNPVAVTISNSRISEKEVVARLPFHSDLSDIQNTISSYEKPTTTNSKIGMVVSVEYFQRKPKEASAYVIFFDISNGDIILSERIVTKFCAEGRGLTEFWGQSCVFFIKNFVDNTYSKGL